MDIKEIKNINKAIEEGTFLEQYKYNVEAISYLLEHALNIQLCNNTFNKDLKKLCFFTKINDNLYYVVYEDTFITYIQKVEKYKYITEAPILEMTLADGTFIPKIIDYRYVI